MIVAELPIDEKLRLLDLASYDIMDSGAETDFDELVDLAADICNCPISLITLVDEDRQWFKARHGVEKTSTNRDVAFCSHVILQDKVMMVENALDDVRFFDNPLVTGEDNIRFYAGAPIISPDGFKLGTICVIDNIPKKLSSKEEKALVVLSNQVTKLLELRKKNSIIRDHASEMIALKSSTIGSMILKQESEKSDIAYNLHEDIAQRLSSIMLYLRMARGSEVKRDEYLKIADEQTNDLLNTVRNLSYSITPYAAKWIPAEELIAEFIEKTADTFPFHIRFIILDGDMNKSPGNALTGIRIIELWMKYLADRKTVSEVILKIITAGRELVITIENNGPVINFEELKKYIFESSIYERATAIEGSIDISLSPGGSNTLKVVLPHTGEENTD